MLPTPGHHNDTSARRTRRPSGTLSWHRRDRAPGRVAVVVPPYRRDPRGVGLLFGVIIIFLLTMMTIGIAQHFFSSRVTSGTASGILGTISVSIGQSALEEAWKTIAVQANNMDEELYRQLRKPLSDPSEALAVFDIDVPLTLSEMEAVPDYSNFEIENGTVRGEVLGAGTMAGLTYENLGTIKLSVRVRHSSGLSRKLVATRGFKSALLSTPRPFDQATFFVMDPTFMIDRQGPLGANAKIQETLDTMDLLGDTHYNYLVKELTRIINDYNDAAQEAQEYGIDLPFKNPNDFTQPFVDNRVPKAEPAYTRNIKDPNHFFPEEAGGYVVFTLKKRVRDLQRLSLIPQIDEANGIILERDARYNHDYQSLLAMMRQVDALVQARDPDDASRVDQLSNQLLQLCQTAAASMAALGRAHATRLSIYRYFTDFFSERSGKAAQELRQFTPKFDIQTTQASRAFFRFRGPDAVKAFERLIKRYNGAGRPLNAIIHLDTEGKLVRLENRRFHGRLVLLVSAPVALSNVGIQDEDQDLLTIHSDQGMTVEGRIQASLVVGGDLRMVGPTRIRGNLALRELRTPEALSGSIRRDGRYRSSRGGKPIEQLQGHFVVALSPKPASTIIYRK